MALPDLIANLGPFCSYCERKLQTGAEVEHIEPKRWHTDLAKIWENFLLACKNCNTCKGSDNTSLADWLVPDRDNTFAAFSYEFDGVVTVSKRVPADQEARAEKTLEILNLNKSVRRTFDLLGNLVAIDKRTQRMEAWIFAEHYRSLWDTHRHPLFEQAIVDLAHSGGFFSIWMAAFSGVPTMRVRFINKFVGTELACFDANTEPVSPHPNIDGLAHGSKL